MGNYVRGYARGTPVRNRNATNLKGEHYGIELELRHGGGYRRLLEALPDTNNPALRPATEQDGSLHHDQGLEIIFPPMKPSQINSKNSFFSRAVQALDDARPSPTDGYGMHVNVNTGDWTIRENEVMVGFFHRFPATLLAKLGGRRLNRWCLQFSAELLAYEHYSSFEAVSSRTRGSHGHVVSPRDGRLELRFPKATTDIYRIQAVVKFVQYVREFLKEKYSEVSRQDKVLSVFPDAEALGASFLEYVASQRKTKSRDRLLEFLAYAPSKNRNQATRQAV